MRGFLILLFAGVFSAASSGADIRDVRDLSSGDGAALFIGFDSVPELLSTQVSNRLIELEFAGGSRAGARRIETANGQTVSALEVIPAETSQRLRIELPAGADGLDISPTETGYLLRWNVTGSTVESVIAAHETPPAMAHITPPENSQVDLPETDEPATEIDTGTESTSGPVALNPVDACAAAQSAVEADSWDIDALAVHSECLLDDGDATQAIVLLERVIAFEPGRFDAVLTLAEAHEARGSLDAARGFYEQAATVAATDGQAVAARARARALED
jgi:tetratricopeptide (TPR) repeat protein